jgi:hypothetical protein
MDDLKARKKKREKINNLVAERLASNPELDEKTARVQINREAVLRIRLNSPLLTYENSSFYQCCGTVTIFYGSDSGSDF